MQSKPTDDHASPEASEEALMIMLEIMQSGIDLINNSEAIDDLKDALRSAIQTLFNEYSVKLEKAQSNLFPFTAKDQKPSELINKIYDASKATDIRNNDKFKEVLASNAKKVGEFLDLTASICGHSKKEIDAQGHKRRSKNRPTIVHEFQTPSQEVNGDKHFIIYMPAGRLTDRQMTAQGLDPQKDSRAHSTTSHNKKGLVNGNSSFVRMVTGTKHSDGSVTISNDSFSGPGARMPYKDLKGADAKKRMAVKAITFMNQEEIIQSLAQRVYDQKLAGKSIDELISTLNNFPEKGELSDANYRTTLIKQYFTENSLAVSAS